MAQPKGTRFALGSVPYISFATFTTALAHLRNRGVPSKVDASVFPHLSGAMASHVLATMRFLSVIDMHGLPKPELAQLVEEKTRGETLKSLIQRSYGNLLSKVDLAKASPSQFDEALREYNVTGNTHRKAKTFLIRAAQFAGMQVSRHLLKRTRPFGAHGTRRRQSESAAEKQEKSLQDTEAVLQGSSPGFSRTIRLHQTGGALTLSGNFDPFALRGLEREVVYRLIDILDEFEAQPQRSR